MRSSRGAMSSSRLFLPLIAVCSLWMISSQRSSVLASPFSRRSHHHNRRRNHSFQSSIFTTTSSNNNNLDANQSYEQECNTINSWNVRSLSSLHLSAQPPPLVRRRRFLSSSSSSIDRISKASMNDTLRGRNNINSRRQSHPTFNQNIVSLTSNSNRNKRKNEKIAKQQQQQLDDPDFYNNEEEYLQSIAEMTSQLGPVGKLVANSVQVGIAAIGSYISGAFFGYFVGGITGVPSIFSSNSGIDSAVVKNNNVFKEFTRKMGNLNSKALTQGKSWGTLSASFSGFHALTRVCRGGVEDRWNSILGSACAGAYLNRNGKKDSIFFWKEQKSVCIILLLSFLTIESFLI